LSFKSYDYGDLVERRFFIVSFFIVGVVIPWCLWGSIGEGGSACRDIETGSIFAGGGGSSAAPTVNPISAPLVDANLIVLSSGSEDEVD
jgi:hypothetical protein